MGTAKGAYVLADADGGQLDVILIGTGSEMSFCVDAYEQLTPEGIKARMVSKPSREFFSAPESEIPGQRPAFLCHRSRFGGTGL